LELIVQPQDGIRPILDAVEKAQKSVDIIIFRFDLKPLEKALEAAVGRGVAVRALIAHTNAGGEKRLRDLELRMLKAGVTVTRTGNELIRYHGKMMIVDRQALHVYGFNYTARDLASRSFGLIARERRVVQEALRLFDADAQREEFETTLDGFVVSPENAREQLATFLKRAKKSIEIYDPKVADPGMIRILHRRAKAGVDVRIIGRVSRQGSDFKAQKMPGFRLHVRAIIRDDEEVFVGSQSLRDLELEARREVGLITRDPKVVKAIDDVFEADWAQTELGKKEIKVHEKELALEEVAL
jgi:phosphatidylserine/phosphatidylglycerophosphate/cardiolipin synthase-like enzyme